MRRYILSFFLILILGIDSYSQEQQVWMLGPMLHMNFSNKEKHTSFGLELAYWNYDHFPYSFDGGIEFEKKKIRLYSEAQTGLGLLGVSLGPVMELRTNEQKLKAGIQGSVWANYFGGIDIRFREVGGTSSFSPGVYFKIPVIYGEGSDDEHHSWDWDFDD